MAMVPEKETGTGGPGVTEMLLSYVDACMPKLGPYVSSVFFVLLLCSVKEGKRRKGYIRTTNLSICDIARASGISRRKVIDALKVLRRCWITVQRNGRGRGNKNRYYFLPVERWLLPGADGHGGTGLDSPEGDPQASAGTVSRR